MSVFRDFLPRGMAAGISSPFVRLVAHGWSVILEMREPMLEFVFVAE